jgi:hypothetical protein
LVERNTVSRRLRILTIGVIGALAILIVIYRFLDL